MRISTLLLLGALVAPAHAAWADPTGLLAPDDPTIGSGWHVSTSPLHGVERFAPAEPKNWIELNKAITPKVGGAGMSNMSGMGGMK